MYFYLIDSGTELGYLDRVLVLPDEIMLITVPDPALLPVGK